MLAGEAVHAEQPSIAGYLGFRVYSMSKELVMCFTIQQILETRDSQTCTYLLKVENVRFNLTSVIILMI